MSLGFRAFTKISRISPEIIARLCEYSPPNLADAMQKTGVVNGSIRPVYSPMPRFAGPAITVSLPTGSFNVKKYAMEMTQAGDVLVIAAKGITHHSLMGGNICLGLKHRGLNGVIIDGAIRDPLDMQKVGLPIHASGVAMNSGPIVGPGEVNVPIAFGGCVIFPGDIIVADIEGIAVVPYQYAEDVLKKLDNVRETETKIQPALLRGEVTNIDKIQQSLVASGFGIIDDFWT